MLRFTNSMEQALIGRFGELAPNRILREIVEKPGEYKDYTFIVLGRPGPTGKTWLTNGLKEYGFTAFEVSEAVGCFVEYLDNKNHIIENHISKSITIILNDRLNWEGK